MTARRVVVSGIGVVSSVGADRTTFERSLRDGLPGIRRVTLFDTTGYRSAVAGEVADFRPGDRLPAAALRETSRTDALGLVAAAEALEDAALGDADRADLAVVVGGTTGGMPDAELDLAALHRDRSTEVPLSRIRSHPLSSTADRVAEAFGIQGPRATVCTACSSGANAVGMAARLIRTGRVRAALAGGADALCRLTFAGFSALAALDPEACRPFDRSRRGLSLGEGAAMLLVEDLEHAIGRGARPYAELRGFANTAEAHHITNPLESGAGAARALGLALADAGIAPHDVDYVNAHGTATELNDPMEALALAEVFGPGSSTLPCSSTKGQVGHTLGAAGAVEAAATLLAMRGGFVPPTVGLSDPDPACPLGHVMGRAKDLPVRFALSNSFGFGGNDTVLVFGPPDADPPPSATPRRRSVVVTARGAIPDLANAIASGDAPPGGSGTRVTEDLRALLHPARGRRMDRLSRMATVAAKRALDASGIAQGDRSTVGLVLGTAWGSFDRSAAFMDRLLTRGPRFAEPAEFPNLLASAPAGHASIYHGLTGPNLSVAALDASGDLAVAVAALEIEAGAADLLLAGAAEETSELVEVLLSRAGLGGNGAQGRGEGAAIAVLEEEGRAVARGARVEARIGGIGIAGGLPDADLAPVAAAAVRQACPDGCDVAALVHSGAADSVTAAALACLGKGGGAGSGCCGKAKLVSVEGHTGRHEARGAVVFSVATNVVARERRPVLTLGVAPGTAIACLLLPA